MFENDSTEFKSCFTKDSLKSVVAFLNTAGGVIYYGLANDGSVIGLESADETAKTVTQSMMDNIRPDVIYYTKVVPMEIEGRQIVQLVVLEGMDKPYYLKEKGPNSSGVYIRKGPISSPAPESAVMKMVREHSPTLFESSVSVEQDLTFESTSAYFQKRDIPFGKPQMKSMGFYRGTVYTNLAYLLSDQNTQGIKMAVFNNGFKQEFLSRSEAEGSVLSQFEVAMGFISTHNDVHTSITGIVRTDTRRYSEVAVREALINAIVHRDYSINGSILVSFIGDELTITSLGGLPKNIGYDEMRLGVSSPRNPKLAAVFHHLGLIEAYGTGIPRIYREYRDSPFTPRIETATNAFKIILPPSDVTVEDPAIKQALDIISAKDAVTRAELQSSLGVSRSKATDLLNRLMDQEKVESIGTGRNTAYRIRR